MKSRELQRLWWDWLGTSERLLHSLHEQTAALTLRQVDRIERIQPELDSLLTRIQDIDFKASSCAKGLAEELGSEPSLRSLVRALEKSEAEQVQQIANRVTVAARNIQHVMNKNRVLIENELDYVNGSAVFIAKAATKSQGKFAATSHAAVLLDQAA